jgi:peptidoglycan/LPS O-acetylase OafA/YrhL
MPGPLRAIGRYSYGIYVLHYPLAYLLNELQLVERYRFGLWIADPTVASLAYAATLMLLSIAAGAVSWHAYEKHFLKLRRYIPYRYAPAAPTAIPQQRATAA